MVKSALDNPFHRTFTQTQVETIPDTTHGRGPARFNAPGAATILL
jgi:hypothetical protein